MKGRYLYVITSVFFAGALLFIVYVNAARTFSKQNILSRSEYYIITLSDQLVADAKKDNYTISKGEVINSISLKTDPKWYQYLPEHWVLEADLMGEDHLRYYTWVPKVEDRQDGKWFREIDPEEVPNDIGFWDGMRRAAILAVIALAIIGLLIVRPIVKALEKNK